jgi:small subunit ribosomal protein S17
MVTEKKTTRKPAAPKAEASAPSQPADSRNALQKRRTVVGEVVSDKMQKTIVVKVDRRVRHGLYKKYIVRSRRFKAHDEKNDAKVGDRVLLTESRPLSRDKRWVLTQVIRRAGQTQDANV